MTDPSDKKQGLSFTHGLLEDSCCFQMCLTHKQLGGPYTSCSCTAECGCLNAPTVPACDNSQVPKVHQLLHLSMLAYNSWITLTV